SQPIASIQSAPTVQSLPPAPIVKQSVEVTAPKQEVAEVTPSVPPGFDTAFQSTQTTEENRDEKTVRSPEQLSRSMPSQGVAAKEPPKVELPDQQEAKTLHPEATESTQEPPAEPRVPKKAPPKPEAVTPLAEAQQQAPAPESPKLQDAALEVAKAAGIQPREWVLKRSPDHFALQIGFFQDPKALAAFARRHPGLRPLAYYPRGKGYVLLYGAFRNIGEVQQAIRRLPPDVGQASIWRFKSIQDAVRSLPSSSVKEP
ncbi:MAG: SPOR domain-containing protein, partial [Methylohalobius sp.]